MFESFMIEIKVVLCRKHPMVLHPGLLTGSPNLTLTVPIPGQRGEAKQSGNQAE